METNPIIFERIKALYLSGQIDYAKLLEYVAKGLITDDEAQEIRRAGE